jgi:hypothetical protein
MVLIINMVDEEKEKKKESWYKRLWGKKPEWTGKNISRYALVSLVLVGGAYLFARGCSSCSSDGNGVKKQDEVAVENEKDYVFQGRVKVFPDTDNDGVSDDPNKDIVISVRYNETAEGNRMEFYDHVEGKQYVLEDVIDKRENRWKEDGVHLDNVLLERIGVTDRSSGEFSVFDYERGNPSSEYGDLLRGIAVKNYDKMNNRFVKIAKAIRDYKRKEFSDRFMPKSSVNEGVSIQER